MICDRQLVRLIRIEGDNVGDGQAAEARPLARHNDLRGVQRPARQSGLMDGLKARRDLHNQRPDLVLRQHGSRRHCARH